MANFLEKFITESVKKVGSYETGNKKATVHKDSDVGEYHVKFHTDGKHHVDADYHTDDKEDAHGTAKHWVGSKSAITEETIVPRKRKFKVNAIDNNGKPYSYDHEGYSPRSIHKHDQFNDLGHKLVSIKHNDKDVTYESFLAPEPTPNEPNPVADEDHKRAALINANDEAIALFNSAIVKEMSESTTLSEISTKTLKSYLHKSLADFDNEKKSAKEHKDHASATTNHSLASLHRINADDHTKTARKRSDGINRVGNRLHDRLTKESLSLVESVPLNEVSDELVSKYKRVAELQRDADYDSANRHANKASRHFEDAEDHNGNPDAKHLYLAHTTLGVHHAEKSAEYRMSAEKRQAGINAAREHLNKD